MPVAAVLAYAVPGPNAAEFVHGEQALGVASPIGAAAGRTVFRLSRWFDFDGGVYTLKTLAEDAANIYLSLPGRNCKLLAMLGLGQGVTSTQVFIPAGRHRIDVVLSNISPDPSACYIALSLFKSNSLIYASAAAGWVFDTVDIPDADVPVLSDRRLSLRVFTVLPNWQQGITERLEYLTEALGSEVDVEQRRTMRRYPRRSFEAQFARYGAARSRLQQFLTTCGNDEILVPLWHEQFRLPLDFALTVQFPDSVVEREFQPGTLAMLQDKRPDLYDILLVESVNTLANSVTFSTPNGLTQTWLAGSRITPLRPARVTDLPAISNLTDRVGTVGIRFTLSDPDRWVTPAWGHCGQLFCFKIDRGSTLNMNFERVTYTTDNQTGRIDVADPGRRTRYIQQCGLTLRGRSQVYQFRAFVAQARGRALRFWMPTFMQDMQHTGNPSGSSFDIQDIDLSSLMRDPQDMASTIGIIFKDRDRPALYREITNVTRIAGGERVFVDTPLPALVGDEIERITFIAPARFEQDAFELNHLVDDSAVVQTTVVTRSSDLGIDPPDESP